MKKSIKIIALGSLVLAISGCGGSSDNISANAINSVGFSTQGVHAKTSNILEADLAEGFSLATGLSRFLIRPEAIVGTNGLACLEGSATKNHTDTNGDGLPTMGESISFSFDNCKTELGDVLDGNVVVEFKGDVVNNDPIFIVDEAITTFDNLSSTLDGITEVGNGALHQCFSIDITGKVTLLNKTVDDEWVTFTVGNEILTLTHYQLTKEIEAADQGTRFALTADVSVKSGSQAFSYSVVTDTEFVQLAGEVSPSSGSMQISTLEDGSGKLETLGSLVRVSEDLDGDGIFEIVEDFTWGQFKNLNNRLKH